MGKLSDDEILRMLRSGIEREEDEALKILIRRNRSKVINYIKKNSRDSKDGEDIFTDSLMALWTKIKGEAEFKAISTLDAFLFGIARNKWRKKVKKQIREREAERIYEEEIPLPPTIEEEITKQERKDEHNKLLADGLGKIGSHCRELLKARHIDKLSIADIQNKYSYKNANVTKVALARCLKKLKKIMGKENFDDWDDNQIK